MLTIKGLAVRFALGLAALAAIPAVSNDAAACGDVFIPEIDHRIQGLANAEQTMRDGKIVASAQSIVRMFPEIRSINPGKDGMLQRAQRTLAVALVRADGGIDLDPTWRGKTPEQRQKNVAWAVAALERLREQRKNDPAVDTDLGEALAKVSGRKDEARSLLQGLADRDLMATPQGYATLGRLQNEAGNTTARDAAVQRCNTMAKDSSICQVPTSQGGQS
ncbi:tetratricopeptide repeat protein [Polyangium jinanense]|uniref:tetratricopeptide repeat protein n=1 Tax=Polyangium jinanense TaxID=2829994 RepID=UPI002340C197|nr:hypothetical protein [Polyangium jinanense]